MLVTRVYSIVKILFYKIKYLNKLEITLFSILNNDSRINIKKGIIRIKSHFLLRYNCKISAISGGILNIGEKFSMNYNSIIVARKNISIGNIFSIGPNVCIYDHNHKFNQDGLQEGYNLSDIIIEDNVWIGANCVILRGTHIGANSVIGAGCVIKGNIPQKSLVTQSRVNNIRPID